MDKKTIDEAVLSLQNIIGDYMINQMVNSKGDTQSLQQVNDLCKALSNYMMQNNLTKKLNDVESNQLCKLFNNHNKQIKKLIKG